MTRVDPPVPYEPRRPVSLHDVAREAGVHSSTASRALTGATDRPVNAQTRARVVEVATRLGYQPNAMARSLKTSSTGAIGMLVPSLRNPFWGKLLRGAFRRAWERGFVVLVAEDDGDDDTEQAYERLIAQARIDGLIVASAIPGSALPGRMLASGAPCVFVARASPGSNRNVTLPEELSSRRAVEHFAELGHRFLGHVSGPEQASDLIERRVRGFLAATRELGLPEPAVARGTLDEAGGASATRELLETRTTAIYVTNFNQAFGAVAAIRSAGLVIPDQISLISADDDPVLDYLEPPLTAFVRPHEELGAAAVDALLMQLEGTPPRDVELETAPELVVRRSTGRPLERGNA